MNDELWAAACAVEGQQRNHLPNEMKWAYRFFRCTRCSRRDLFTGHAVEDAIYARRRFLSDEPLLAQSLCIALHVLVENLDELRFVVLTRIVDPMELEDAQEVRHGE